MDQGLRQAVKVTQNMEKARVKSGGRAPSEVQGQSIYCPYLQLKQYAEQIIENATANTVRSDVKICVNST